MVINFCLSRHERLCTRVCVFASARRVCRRHYSGMHRNGGSTYKITRCYWLMMINNVVCLFFYNKLAATNYSSINQSVNDDRQCLCNAANSFQKLYTYVMRVLMAEHAATNAHYTCIFPLYSSWYLFTLGCSFIYWEWHKYIFWEWHRSDTERQIEGGE